MFLASVLVKILAVKKPTSLLPVYFILILLYNAYMPSYQKYGEKKHLKKLLLLTERSVESEQTQNMLPRKEGCDGRRGAVAYFLFLFLISVCAIIHICNRYSSFDWLVFAYIHT